MKVVWSVGKKSWMGPDNRKIAIQHFIREFPWTKPETIDSILKEVPYIEFIKTKLEKEWG